MGVRDGNDGTKTFGEPKELVVSNWIEPLEVLVPQSKFTEPLTICSLTEFKQDEYNVENKIGPDEVLLAHETDFESAKGILSEGFKPERNGYTPLRDRAVFGWVHSTDVGQYHNQFEDAGTVVLYKSRKEHCYVSSYESSASKLILGEIKPWEYERKHVLTFTQYEEILWQNPELVEHLPYDKTDFIGF